jgi:peptidoglycan/xylan/chitin deacetylase (PgdA/CDA1 family)
VNREVPPLKPRPWYLLGKAHQAARVAAARARGAGDEPWTGVRIFGYHRVTPENDVLAVTPDQFKAHLEVLLASDVAPVRLAGALDLLGSPVGGRHACLTFDDGFQDVLLHAAPILREYRVPATVYLPTAVIDGLASYTWYRDPPPAMSWGDVSELIADGWVDVQPHSRTHPRLPALTEGEAREEIAGSKADLEARVRVSATTFSYPAGLYTAREATLALESGYRAAVTTRSGVNDPRTPLGELRRTMIAWRDGPLMFRAKLDGLLDRPSWLTERLQRRRVED